MASHSIHFNFNYTIIKFEVRENIFSSQELVKSMQENRDLHFMDLRETNIPKNIMDVVSKMLVRNFKGYEDIEDEQETETRQEIVEEVVEDKHKTMEIDEDDI